MASSTSPGKRLTQPGGLDWEEAPRPQPTLGNRRVWPGRLAAGLVLLAILAAASWSAAWYVNTHRPDPRAT